MKIECDKCSAKYSIADEKVRGKTFKIRCKKCSNVIIVRDKAAAPVEAAPQPEAAADPGWHLAINGETVGPIAEVDVRARYDSGEIDKETAVWQEGFEDWLPLGDVSAFADLPDRTAAESPAAAADPFAAASGGDDYASGGGGLGDAGGGLGAGLGGGAAPLAAASSPRVDSLTGQRNENSVLFSLDNLQALATGGAAGAATASVGGGAKALATSAPSSEGSGLIDIRALGAMVGGDSGGGGGGGGGDESLPSFGGGGGFGGLSAAPLVAQPVAGRNAGGPAARKSNAGMMFMLTTVVVLLLGAVGFLGYTVLNKQDTPAERVVIQEVVPSVKGAAEDKAKDEDKDDDKDEKDEKDEEKGDADGPKGLEGGAEGVAGAGSSSKGTRGRGRGKGRARGKTGGGGGGAASLPDPKPVPSGGGGGGGGGGKMDVDCILNPDLAKCKKGGGGKKRSGGGGGGGASDPSAPAKLSQADVRAGITVVKPAAKACGSKHRAAPGTKVTVKLSIQGATGRVVSAKATGEHAGKPLGNCVAQAAKKATFKKVKKPQTGVQIPFRM